MNKEWYLGRMKVEMCVESSVVDAEWVAASNEVAVVVDGDEEISECTIICLYNWIAFGVSLSGILSEFTDEFSELFEVLLDRVNVLFEVAVA